MFQNLLNSTIFSQEVACFFLLSRWFFGTLQVEMISSRNLIFAELYIYIYICAYIIIFEIMIYIK